MILAELRLGLVQFDWTFVFQLINTVGLIVVVFWVYKLIKKVFANKSKLESRVTSLEDEIRDLKRRD